MADVVSTSSTVVSRQVTGHQRVIIADYSATTSAGSDTVATPLSVVDWVGVGFVSTAALTTATVVDATPSTQAGGITVWTSTHDGLSVRYEVKGR